MSDLIARVSEPFALADGQVILRLLYALFLGGVVTLVYRATRSADEVAPSFTVTLVLLSVLIAMVTQAIGDNVARAFSLVGALSIVRFRTVVRDTQDTAYVIFAVAVGMATGAGHIVLAISGIAVVAAGALAMRRNVSVIGERDPYLVKVRLGVGHDPAVALGRTFDEYLASRRLSSIETARQGMALEVTYRAALRDNASAGELVKALNRVEGVQNISLQLAEPQEMS